LNSKALALIGDEKREKRKEKKQQQLLPFI
jgi:hypothetical protein